MLRGRMYFSQLMGISFVSGISPNLWSRILKLSKGIGLEAAFIGKGYGFKHAKRLSRRARCRVASSPDTGRGGAKLCSKHTRFGAGKILPDRGDPAGAQLMGIQPDIISGGGSIPENPRTKAAPPAARENNVPAGRRSSPFP